MKKRIITAIIIATAMTLTSCAFNDTSLNKNDDLAMPAHEYGITLGQELTTVLNQLTTRMGNGRLIASGSGDVELELSSTDYSIGVVNECIDVVKELNIVGSYTVERDETLRLFKEVSEELKNYKKSLNKKEKDIRDSISRMEMLFTSITSLSNQVYK